jgi:hypothetical protein
MTNSGCYRNLRLEMLPYFTHAARRRLGIDRDADMRYMQIAVRF